MRSPPALRLLSLAMGRGLSTVDWPRQTLASEGPPRRVPVFDAGSCTACGRCVPACPSGCITLEDVGGAPAVDAGNCVRCGRCVEACGEGAVTMTGEARLAAYARNDLVLNGSAPEEVDLGPPPSRLYRMAVDRGGRTTVEPLVLLRERSSSLLRDDRGKGEG